MKVLAAYMLIALSGAQPTADSVAALLTKVDANAEPEKIAQLFTALEGKNIDEVIAEGQKKLLAVGSGAAPAGGAAAPAAAAGGAAPAAAAPKKEEKKEEEEVDVGGGDLFGGGAKDGY